MPSIHVGLVYGPFLNIEVSSEIHEALRDTLSPILMVQWKVTRIMKGHDPIGETHFLLNHDYGRKGKIRFQNQSKAPRFTISQNFVTEKLPGPKRKVPSLTILFQRMGVLLADGYTPENQIIIFGMNVWFAANNYFYRLSIIDMTWINTEVLKCINYLCSLRGV